MASELFIRKYGDDFQLIFRMSAKAALSEPEIRGPTMYRKYKNVEYLIFLPFDAQEPRGQEQNRKALRQLLDAIVRVLQRLQIDVAPLVRDADEIIERIVTDPKMIDDRD